VPRANIGSQKDIFDFFSEKKYCKKKKVCLIPKNQIENLSFFDFFGVF